MRRLDDWQSRAGHGNRKPRSGAWFPAPLRILFTLWSQYPLQGRYFTSPLINHGINYLIRPNHSDTIIVLNRWDRAIVIFIYHVPLHLVVFKIAKR